MRRLRLAAAAVLVGAGVLSGCTGGSSGSGTSVPSGADSGTAGGSGSGSAGDQGFVSGKGTITVFKVADRRSPSAVEGTSLTGSRLSLAGLEGKVVVLNVWGSWCPPCRAEAPVLAATARELQPRGVEFLGIDSRDPERAGPRAFVRQFKVPYDSIYDPSGRTLLAFHGTAPPNAVPSTLVIDRRGRVAAVILGQVTRTTLKDLVEDVSA